MFESCSNGEGNMTEKIIQSSMNFNVLESSELSTVEENGLTLLVANASMTSRKSCYFYDKQHQLIRAFVSTVLAQYVRSGLSVSKPVKCIDVLGAAGTSGFLWKKLLADKVDVKINNPLSTEVVRENASKNNLSVEICNKDACIVLHERGYNFIYLDCTIEASHYFEAAFRNISRNGLLVVTTKDDCSLHGGNPDVALRRYGGRITRTLYYHELGIRLVLAAMARSAVKYNKTFKVLSSLMYKNTFTIVVMIQKGPMYANLAMDQIRLLKHCMACEERAFYPPQNGFPIDHKHIKLQCNCQENAPGEICYQLGPLWAGDIFDSQFIEEMLQLVADLELKTLLSLVLEEARCPCRDTEEKSAKRLKMDFSSHPPFYYNLHKHHPHLNQLMKLNSLIDAVRLSGYRASKTHFDNLALRTNAPLNILFEIMKKMNG